MSYTGPDPWVAAATLAALDAPPPAQLCGLAARTLAAFDAAGIAACVTGSLAAWVAGNPRVPGDIDVEVPRMESVAAMNLAHGLAWGGLVDVVPVFEGWREGWRGAGLAAWSVDGVRYAHPRRVAWVKVLRAAATLQGVLRPGWRPSPVYDLTDAAHLLRAHGPPRMRGREVRAALAAVARDPHGEATREALRAFPVDVLCFSGVACDRAAAPALAAQHASARARSAEARGRVSA